MTPALATVIIPCGEKHLPLLPRAIHSARVQTVPNVEVLWFVDTFAGTPAYGRNLLAQRAKGLFVVQLDADDFLMPNAIERWLSVWQPGMYVTSDFYMGQRHVKAVSCYGMKKGAEDEQNFHLPPSLFPTNYWRMMGGQNETLFGAEDTEFFMRANLHRIKHRIVREPLFHYTDQGFRSREAGADPKWNALLKNIFTMRGGMSMGCCGDIAPLSFIQGQQSQPDDVLARPTWSALQKTRGRATGTNYGVISKDYTVWIRKADYDVAPQDWVLVTDWQSQSPSINEVQGLIQPDPNDPIAVREYDIRRAGVRASYNPDVPYGYDMMQNPHELTVFLNRCQALGVRTVLEIGTGSGGLARYLAANMGWEVTSVDTEPLPAATQTLLSATGRWRGIWANSHELHLTELELEYDLVFVDGDHTLEGLISDFDRFGALATKAVAVHDVSPDGFFPHIGTWWQEQSRTPKTKKLRDGYHEAIETQSVLGIGWIEI